MNMTFPGPDIEIESCNTLIAVLKVRKELSDAGVTFIEPHVPEKYLSYSELYDSALKVLSYLQESGLKPGNELVFQLEDNHEFIVVFWACILGGILPVPLTVGKNADHKQKFFNVWPLLKNPGLITSTDIFNSLGEYAREKGLAALYSEIGHKMLNKAGILSAGDPGEIFVAGENDIAFVQFSSGSTGKPKGVMLSHKNIIANVRAISKAAGYTNEDSTLSWMPLTHDMGLIGFHINPLFCGMNQYLMPPGLFVRRPALWMDKASGHKTTILCSPNFGYEYLIRHCDLGPGVFDWDLSAVRLLYNGAEPISERLCLDFLKKMAGFALRKEVMCPVYGLAEASLAVSISGLDNEIMSLAIARNQMNIGCKVSYTDAPEDGATFVNVGSPVPGCLLRISDDGNKGAGDEIIGHVQIKGDNVTTGYYNNLADTENLFTEDRWLKTGDLGFTRNGSLFIIGRTKDIFFSSGKNFYSHDIERIAQEVDGIELNKVVVTGYFDDILKKEQVIAFVLHRGEIATFIPTARSLMNLINRKTGAVIDRIIPVKDIPRTTSGKLQRFRLIEMFKSGQLGSDGLRMDQLFEEAGESEMTDLIPQDDNEELLMKIWKEVLGITRISYNDDFFSIGGNSLKAAEMAILVLKEFQVDLPVETIYKKSTIRELAAAIYTFNKKEYVPVRTYPGTLYPLATAQTRLYYYWQTNKHSLAYNVPVAVRIEATIDVGTLERSLKQMIGRHDILRTVFLELDKPQGKVLDELRFSLNYTDCSKDGLDDQLKALVRPFDLVSGPLFRAELLRQGAGEHILLLDFHHIIIDGISVNYFIKELFDLYLGVSVPPVMIQYKDYAASEETYIGEIDRQETYWLGHLHGKLPILEMPLDFPRPPVFDIKGSKIEFRLEQPLIDKIRHFAAENSCTVHVLLFTIYHLLLSKYTGQKDILVGIPVSGRNHPDLRRMLGMFVNNLAIRASLSDDHTFYQLLSDRQSILRKGLENQAYPFGNLVKMLNTTRDLSRNPLFDTMFIYQNMGFPEIQETSFRISHYRFDPGFSKFDISLEIFEEKERLIFSIEYADSLFSRSTIINFAKHFGVLANRLIDDPHSKVSDLPVITDREYDEYIRKFNDTDAPYPRFNTIHELFGEQVRKTPGSIAVEYGLERMTYEQLNSKAEDIASLLQQAGVARGNVVAILQPRSSGLICSILGILKAGAAYLPIEHDLPVERIRFLLENSLCKMVLVDRVFDTFPFTDALPDTEFLCIDTAGPPKRSGQPGENSGPRDAAYIIYTSGTTGQPKGVVIEHRSLVNYIHWAIKVYMQDGMADFPLYTSISFDLTVTSIFVPLVTGNRVIVYDETAASLVIERVIAEDRVDILKSTPSHLAALLNSSSPSFLANGRLKKIIVGGEKLETSLAIAIYHKFNGNIELFNEYGPTEATVGCMIYQFDPEDDYESVPIGLPAANTRIYLLDKWLQPVPAGVHGEIYIAGDGLAREYLFNEGATTEKFIPDVFREGEKMYKTGDIARRLENETLLYVGRVDLQVKIHGYRIELAEIERNLANYPGMAGVIITVRNSAKDSKVICAYYSSSAAISSSILRNFLALRLPYYMIPVSFTWIQTVPLTRNGKIDHDALPKPDPDASFGRRIIPRNQLEVAFLNIWKEVLGATEVAVTDNFLELGGDSIKAVQIAFRLAVKGISVSAKDILTYQVIEEIALHAKIREAGTSYEQGAIEGERDLLPIESWFFNQHFTNPDFYNQSVLLDLKREISAELLGKAFQILIRHHDGLRSNYNPVTGKMIYRDSYLDEEFMVEEIVCSPDLPGSLQKVKSKFDITNGLLLKAFLIRGYKGFGMLLMTAHHLIIDGVSWRILLEDLYSVYDALYRGIRVELPQKTASLRAWQNKLSEFQDSPAMKMEEYFWETTEDPGFSIPVDFKTEDSTAENLAVRKASLSKEATGYLLKGAHLTYNTDMPILLNVALLMMLKEWTGRNEFVIEQEGHGRSFGTIDTSRTLGWFTAMYPVTLKWPGGHIGDVIKAVKEQIRNVPGQGIGYGIWKFWSGSRHQQHSPERKKRVTQIRFNYLGQFDRELNNDLFSYSDETSGRDTDPCNEITATLEFNMMVIRQVFHLEISYNGKAYKESTISWISDTFLTNILSIMEHVKSQTNPHFTPSDFKIDIDQQELDALLK